MHALHRGSSVVRITHRSARSSYVCNRCVARYLHSSPLRRRDENGASADSQASSTAPARPATRRQGSQLAGRMIQGLRVAAPGGFGTTKAKPRTASPARSEAIEKSLAPPKGDLASPRNTRQQTTPRKRRDAPRRADKAKSFEVAETNNDQPQQGLRSRGPSNRLVTTLQESTDPSVDLEAALITNDLPLARRILERKLVRFVDEEEKQRVLKLAGELAAKDAERTGREVQGVGFAPVPAAYRDMVSKKAIAGNHEAVQGVKGKTPQERTMSHLKTALQLNNSYSPLQQQALLRFMNRMWPAQRPGRGKTA